MKFNIEIDGSEAGILNNGIIKAIETRKREFQKDIEDSFEYSKLRESTDIVLNNRIAELWTLVSLRERVGVICFRDKSKDTSLEKGVKDDR